MKIDALLSRGLVTVFAAIVVRGVEPGVGRIIPNPPSEASFTDSLPRIPRRIRDNPPYLLATAHVGTKIDAPFGGAVQFEQRIGATLPLSTRFLDPAGNVHALGDYFHGKPVVLYFGYQRCPQLCSLVADGTVAALRQIRPEAGRDFEVVSVSIDPTETMAENKTRQTEAVRRYGRAGVATGWNFLTGDELSIRAVADAAGFHYVYDPRSHQFAHASGFVVVTAKGVVSRYFLGVDFVPTDVARAITRAGEDGVGQAVYDLLLLCFRGDGISGRYGAIIWRVLTVAVGCTILVLVGGIGWMLREERRKARRAQEGTS